MAGSIILSTGRLAAQVSAHLSHCEDEVHGWVLGVDAFQLHAQSEAILVLRDQLALSRQIGEDSFHLSPCLIDRGEVKKLLFHFTSLMLTKG